MEGLVARENGFRCNISYLKAELARLKIERNQ